MSLEKPTLDDLRIDRTQERRNKTPKALIIVLLLLAVGAGVAVWWMKRPKAIPVRTILVEAPPSSKGHIYALCILVLRLSHGFADVG